MFLVIILIWESTKAKHLWAEYSFSDPAIVNMFGENKLANVNHEDCPVCIFILNYQSESILHFVFLFFFSSIEINDIFFTSHIVSEALENKNSEAYSSNY